MGDVPIYGNPNHPLDFSANHPQVLKSPSSGAQWLFHGLNHLLHLFHRAEADTETQNALVVLTPSAALRNFPQGGVLP